MRRTIGASLAAVWLGACSPVIPDKTVELTSTLSFTYAEILGAALVIGAIYYVVDPLAPNWEIKEVKLDDTRYRIEMRKKRVTTGGDGESIDLFHRQAEQLAANAKAPGYAILSWNEGVDSEFPIARRWSRGVIEVQPDAGKVATR